MRVDEDGEYWNIAAGALIGGVISAAFEAANQLISCKTKGSSFDVGAVVAAGLSGAIVGGFTASGLGKAGQAVGNALGSMVTESYAQWKSGSDLNTAAINVLGSMVASAIDGYRGGPGLRAKGSEFSELLMKNSEISNKIKNGGYKTLSVGAKRLRQNVSALNKVKRNVTIKTTKATISSYAKEYIMSYIPGAYNWLKSNW